MRDVDFPRRKTPSKSFEQWRTKTDQLRGTIPNNHERPAEADTGSPDVRREETMNRRESLKFIGGATALMSLVVNRALAQAPNGPFKLPPLGYAFDSLEPHIDAQTMMIHHDRHHATYVNNANNLAQDWSGLATTPIEQVLSNLNAAPENVRTGIRNNVGGHWNHTFFWELMTPGGAKEPSSDLKSAIDSTFGSVSAMSDKVNTAGGARFGSGWAWLVVNKEKKLDVISTANQDTPLELGARAVLGVDVWEHAYYLKYQNRRADYLKAWWNTVNWTKVGENFKKAMG
jgi:Fe-Mn family superoxide dismutase